MWISTQIAKEQLAQPLSCIPLSEVLDQNVYIVKPIQCGRVRGAVQDPKCGRGKGDERQGWSTGMCGRTDAATRWMPVFAGWCSVADESRPQGGERYARLFALKVSLIAPLTSALAAATSRISPLDVSSTYISIASSM